MYRCYIKSLIDILISFIIFVIVFPVLMIVSLFLFFANSGNPFFFQLRPGKNEKIFRIIKFKTMNDKKDSEGNLLTDAHRLTKIGKFVRKTSIDELPQLINVLKGDMSLIGPRPLLPEYLTLYNELQKKRHEVKPGITGWAQINGRNTISSPSVLTLRNKDYFDENLVMLLDCEMYVFFSYHLLLLYVRSYYFFLTLILIVWGFPHTHNNLNKERVQLI